MESSSVEFWCVHLFPFFHVCDRNVSFPDSPAYNTWPKNIPDKIFGPNWCSRWVFRRHRVRIHHRSKRYHWSAIHVVPSHQKMDLACFEESSTPPWNPPTTHCPDLTATVPQMSLLSLYALLSQQSHLFPICVVVDVQWCQGNSSQDFEGIVMVSSSAPKIVANSSAFLENFSFSMGRIVNYWGANSCTTTANRWLLRNSLFHWDFVICSYHIIKKFCFGRDYHHVFCKKTSLFRLQTDIASWVLLKVRAGIVLARTRFHFAPDSIGNSWAELEGSVSISRPGSRFHGGSERPRSSTKFSLNSFSQSCNSCFRSHCASSRPSFFCFRFLLVHVAGLPEALHSYSHILLALDFRRIVGCQRQNPVMKMMKKLVFVGELVDNQGQRMVRSYFAINSLAIFGEMCFFWTACLCSGKITHVLRRVSPNESGSSLKKHTSDEWVQLLDVYRDFFSCLHLAVGSHHGRGTPRYPNVSNSAELRLFLLTICILGPESTTNYLSSDFFVDAVGVFISSWENRMQPCIFLWACVFLARFHASFRGHRGCLSVSSLDRSSNFIAWGLRWWMTFIFPNYGPFFSRIPAWRSVVFVNRALWTDSKTFLHLASQRLPTLRNECIWILWYTTQLWYTFHHSLSFFVIAFSSFLEVALFLSFFIWLFVNLAMRRRLSGGCQYSQCSGIKQNARERLQFTKKKRQRRQECSDYGEKCNSDGCLARLGSMVPQRGATPWWNPWELFRGKRDVEHWLPKKRFPVTQVHSMCQEASVCRGSVWRLNLESIAGWLGTWNNLPLNSIQHLEIPPSRSQNSSVLE